MRAALFATTLALVACQGERREPETPASAGTEGADGGTSKAAGSQDKGLVEQIGEDVGGAAKEVGGTVEDASQDVGGTAKTVGGAVKKTGKEFGRDVKKGVKATGAGVQDAAQDLTGSDKPTPAQNPPQ